MKYEYSGAPILRHASQNEDLKKFDYKFKGARYDQDGGVFGGKGVYLDADGKWTTKPNDMLWGFNKAYEVKAPIDKGFILTPESYQEIITPKYPLEEIIKSDWINRNNKLIKGKEIANSVKNKGYDSLIVEGWDDLNESIKRDALARGVTVADDSFFGNTLYLGKGRYPKEEEIFREMINSYHPEVQKEYLDNLGKYGLETLHAQEIELLKRGLSEDIGQDQVIHFNKPALKIIGEAPKKTKPFRFSNYMTRVKSLAPFLGPMGTALTVLGGLGYSDFSGAATDAIIPGGLSETANNDSEILQDRKYRNANLVPNAGMLGEYTDAPDTGKYLETMRKRTQRRK